MNARTIGSSLRSSSAAVPRMMIRPWWSIASSSPICRALGMLWVTTTSGSPTFTFNDGGTATYVSGSGTSALTFSYTVLAGQNTPDLMVSAIE